jgi:hypothetical protein
MTSPPRPSPLGSGRRAILEAALALMARDGYAPAYDEGAYVTSRVPSAARSSSTLPSRR